MEDSPCQLDPRVGRYIDKLHGKPEVGPRIDRLGHYADRAFVRQINLESHLPASRHLMKGLDQAAGDAEIVNSQIEVERTAPTPLEGSVDARSAFRLRR